MPTRCQRDVFVRWMIRRDLPEVLGLESDSSPDPWTKEELVEVLRQRSTIGMVAERDGRVVGYMVYQLHSKHIELHRLVVNRVFRRLWVGTQMVEKLTSKLSRAGRDRIDVSVRESNLSAQLFLQDQDFNATSVVRSAYEDTGEDAYLMVYHTQSPGGQATASATSHRNPLNQT